MLTFADKSAKASIASTDEPYQGRPPKPSQEKGGRVACYVASDRLRFTQDKRVLPGLDFGRNRQLRLLKNAIRLNDLPTVLSLGFRAASALVSEY